MKRHRRSKKYRVKEFYSSKANSKKFVSFTVTKDTIRKGMAILMVVFLLPFVNGLWSWTGFMDFFTKAGVSSVLPFFEGDKESMADIGEFLVYSGVSPLFRVADKNEEIPKVNIKPYEEKIKSTSNVSNGVDLKNETDYSIDIVSILAEEMVFNTLNPKVLIVHTHGSESYTPSEKYTYEPSGNYRTQDKNFNVIRVGEELASHLRKKGIEVIHDKTINDHPSYNDSYNKTEKIIKNHISKDRNIVFVFDIHRDAVGDGDNIVKFVSEIKGRQMAQAMIVCGTDTNLTNPDWRENLKVAVHMQNMFENTYPGLFRPLNIRKERFNMHLTKGSLLFEIGTNGNTLDEALATAGILGDGIGDFINNHAIKQDT